MIFLYSFYLLLPILEYFKFTYYEHFVIGIVLVYTYFNPGQTILKKLAFWGLYVKAFAMTGFKVIDVSELCDANKTELNQDCTNASLDLVESVLLNSLCVFLAWQNARTPNGESKEADTTAVKRHIMRQRVMGVVLVLIFLSFKPLMWFMVDMNYPIVDLMRETFNFLV